VNQFEIAATALLAMLVFPGAVMVRARPIDGVVALECAGAVIVTVLLCLSEGFHRSVYFNVALVAVGTTWIGGLVFARFFGRFL
jgi:multisubunit Na+/H+ antiporter MnhF subunit